MDTHLTDQYLNDCYSAKTVLKFIDASRGFDHQLAYTEIVYLCFNRKFEIFDFEFSVKT